MNKTVLVTGSQGFIGSYVCKELLNTNYHVIGGAANAIKQLVENKNTN